MHPGVKRNGAADRLIIIIGMTRREFLKKFHRVNLLDTNYWDPSEAKISGRRLRQRLRGSVFVLGRQAWKALSLPDVDWFGIFSDGRATYTLLPHPSGKNRLVNSLSVRERIANVLRS